MKDLSSTSSKENQINEFMMKFPFFQMADIHCNSETKNQYMMYYPKFEGSLEKVLFGALLRIKNSCEDLLQITDFDEINELYPVVRCSYTTFGENHKKYSWKSGDRFHWINGKFIKNSKVANDIAIKYDSKEFSEEMVKQHAMKVLKRHATRFLREYSSIVKIL